MKRREFFNFAGLGLLATSLPMAIAACSPSEPTSETSETVDESTDAKSGNTDTVETSDSNIREDGFVVIGTVAELDETGALSNEDLLGESVVVVRDPANAEAVVALNSICTHKGCIVAWAETELACPCHQSKFSAEGEVISGPATEPLATFEAMVEGDSVLVKVA